MTGNTPQINTQGVSDPELMAAASPKYGRNVQHIVFGIHGTANDPSHVRPLTEKIASELSNTPNSGTHVDTTFDWSKRAGVMNQPGGREKEGDRFAEHVDKVLTEMKKNGQLKPDMPVQITVVGFSHGGNVAIGATPELAEVMRKHGLNDNGSLHLVTVSTPAYNNGGREDPAYAKRTAADLGLDVHHTHFSPKNDGVIRGALGNAFYDGPGHPNAKHRDGHVYNYGIAGKGFLNPIGSHGSAQDDAATATNINNQADKVASIVAARTLDIHNRSGRPRQGGRLAEGEIDDGTVVAALGTEKEAVAKLATGIKADGETRGERVDAALNSRNLTIGDGGGIDRLDVTGDKQKGLGNIGLVDGTSVGSTTLDVINQRYFNLPGDGRGAPPSQGDAIPKMLGDGNGGGIDRLDVTGDKQKGFGNIGLVDGTSAGSTTFDVINQRYFNLPGDGRGAPPSQSDSMLNTIDSRYFRIGENQVQNPHADRFASLMKDLESPNFGIGKQRDNAAALLEATMTAKFKPDEDVRAMLGSKENVIATQGTGDAANRVSVDIKATDGAFERVSNSLVAQLQQQSQSVAAATPNQEPEQRKPIAVA